MQEHAIVAEERRLDPRVLAIERDAQGKRHMDFKRALDKLVGGVKEEVEPPISGPSTFVWLMRHMYNNGVCPTAFHSRWLSEIRLDYSAAGVSEHQCWCRFFEIMLCHDMIDGSRLTSAELGARKIQMIHDRWKHKMPAFAPQASGTPGAEDDAHLLLGTHETRGNLGVAPALVKWMGEELGREALAQKERRKAREERGLAAAKK